MCDKNCKYNTNKTRRSNTNAINSCTWMFNLVAVALLIQHVACAAAASVYVTGDATTTTKTALVSTKTHNHSLSAHENISSSNNKHIATQTQSGSLATSRHFSVIESTVGSGSSALAVDDGVDFAAYMNDFNMQAEAAIPEDILDQQHIQDVDAVDADSMQYVGDGDGDEAVESEADIILAAQRFSTSESSRERGEYYEHDNNNGDNKNKGSNNKIAQSRKTIRNRNNKLKNNADSNNNNGDNNSNKNDERKYDSDNTAVYNDDDDDSMEAADVLDNTAEEPLALPSATEARQSFVLTRHPRGQQNHKLIPTEDDAQSYEAQRRDVTGRQQQQQQQFIENLVAEKFNKATAQTVNNDDKAKDNMHRDNSNKNNNPSNVGINSAAVDEQLQSSKSTAINKDYNMNKQVNNKSEMEYTTDDNQPEETAIGDIEDKFRNEDDVAGQQLQHRKELRGHQSATIAQQSREGRRQLRGKQVEEDHRQIKKFKHNERASSSTNDNVHANKYNENSNNNRHSFKRHHHGEPPHQAGEYAAKTSTQVSDAALRREQVDASETNQPRHVQQKMPQHVEVADSVGGVAEPQADYSITYFGILTNSSKKLEKTFAEAKAAADEHGNTIRNSAKTADIVAEIADEDDAAKLEADAVHARRIQLQQQQQHAPTASNTDEPYATQTLSSAFERYKAQRRNSRRYGHKMHKKKYKDYLRHATIASLTAKAMTTAIEVATTTAMPHMSTGLPPMGKAFEMSAKHTLNSTQPKLINDNYTDYYRQQKQTGENVADGREKKHPDTLRKYIRKIEAEKSRGLPPSPIFVVDNQSDGVVATSEAHSSRRTGGTSNHFYEGQVNYYLETADDGDTTTKAVLMKSYQPTGGGEHSTSMADGGLFREDEERLRAHERSMEHTIAADNNNWYRRVSPVLRNGIKVYSNEDKVQREEAPSQLPHVQELQFRTHLQRQHATKQQQHYHTHHHDKHRNQHHHQHTPTYQQRQQHHDAQQHRNGSSSHHKHHQNSKHYQSSNRQHQQQQRADSNERKLLDPPSPHAGDTQTAVKLGMVQTPIPPPSYRKQNPKQTEHDMAGHKSRQLGHQITELEELERYYAKWPHLARVQFQLYDEHYREDHPELYPELKVGASDLADNADYDDDYESAAELEEAQNSHDEYANLPPYIKKYNRRNKQLLNLLEGTLPPPTRLPPTLERSWSRSVLQPGPHASSRSAGGGTIRIDDDYLKEKRKRYHNRDIGNADTSSISVSTNNNRKEDRHHYQDLFAQQRLAQITTTQTTGEPTGVLAKSQAISAHPNVSGSKSDVISSYKISAQSNNHLPDEDVSISADTDIEAYAADDGDIDFWQKEIENKSNANELAGSAQMSWQIEKLTTPNPAPNAPKAAIFRLPSYPAIASSFVGKPRSRSAQFAPSGGSRGKLAFLAPTSSELNNNRWGNIYGVGGGNVASAGGLVGVNGLGGTRASYHKSLSRFSAYKPSVYKTLTAAAATASTTTTTPAVNDDDGMNGHNAVATTTTALAVTPSGFGSDDAEGADGANGGVANAVMGRTISSFVYHRVIDASPRLVGTGNTGRKQRLPFVAITDRRLETTKKAQLERQKDFEQNHYPMP